MKQMRGTFIRFIVPFLLALIFAAIALMWFIPKVFVVE